MTRSPSKGGPGTDLSAPGHKAALARHALRPSTRAAETLAKICGQAARADIDALTAEVSQRLEDVLGGSMRRPQAMLMAQSMILEAVAHILIRGGRIAEAIRAQRECRLTIAELSRIHRAHPHIRVIRGQEVLIDEDGNARQVPRDWDDTTRARFAGPS